MNHVKQRVPPKKGRRRNTRLPSLVNADRSLGRKLDGKVRGTQSGLGWLLPFDWFLDAKLRAQVDIVMLIYVLTLPFCDGLSKCVLLEFSGF